MVTLSVNFLVFCYKRNKLVEILSPNKLVWNLERKCDKKILKNIDKNWHFYSNNESCISSNFLEDHIIKCSIMNIVETWWTIIFGFICKKVAFLWLSLAMILHEPILSLGLFFFPTNRHKEIFSFPLSELLYFVSPLVWSQRKRSWETHRSLGQETMVGRLRHEKPW